MQVLVGFIRYGLLVVVLGQHHYLVLPCPPLGALLHFQYIDMQGSLVVIAEHISTRL